MALDKMRLDMAAGSSGVIAIGAASVSAALPASTELIALSSSGNAHFRFSSGASTAVATDPMITSNSQIQLFKLDPSVAITLSAIQDGASTGNLSWFRVFEA